MDCHWCHSHSKLPLNSLNCGSCEMPRRKKHRSDRVIHDCHCHCHSSCSGQAHSHSHWTNSHYAVDDHFKLEFSQRCRDLLSWVNRSLNANYTKIEEFSTGTAYCQLMDMLLPGSLSLKKVKFQSTCLEDSIHNLGILQAAFEKINLKNIVPIDNLVKGRFQENFEFLLWFNNFFHANYQALPNNPYAYAFPGFVSSCRASPPGPLIGYANHKTNLNPILSSFPAHESPIDKKLNCALCRRVTFKIPESVEEKA